MFKKILFGLVAVMLLSSIALACEPCVPKDKCCTDVCKPKCDYQKPVCEPKCDYDYKCKPYKPYKPCWKPYKKPCYKKPWWRCWGNWWKDNDCTVVN